MERFYKLKNLYHSGEDQRKKRSQMMYDFIVYCSNKDLVNEIMGFIYKDTRAIVKRIITEAFPESLSDPETADYYSSIITAYFDGIAFQSFFDREDSRLPETNELFWNMIHTRLQRLNGKTR